MANTTVKPARAPRTPRAPKPSSVEEPEVLETTEAVEPEVTPVSETESVTKPETPELKTVLEEQKACTSIHLVKKGQKYNVYRDSKKLTRMPVTLDKAKLIACGYGESNPTII